MDKQFKYAEKKNIPFAIIIGSKEMEEKTCVVKNLKTGVQQTLSTKNLIEYLRLKKRILNSIYNIYSLKYFLKSTNE
jgi:histidyl-tRNA synthetase